MDLKLKGRTCLITGASGGIGRALTQVFAAEGANLVVHGHSQVEALRSWADSQPFADRVEVVAADLRRVTEVDGIFEQARSRFGRVDICVANAGMWPKPDASLHEASPERIEDTLAINLLGSTWTIRAWMRNLAELPARHNEGASAVLIGSTAGRFGEAFHADYAMAKAGLVGLMRSVKNELPHLDPLARINLVEPGWTVTHMAREALSKPGVIEKVVRTMPLRQLGRAEDVARQVAMLSSPVSGHVSGQIVTVAGGMEGRLLWEPSEIDEAAIRDRAMRS